MSSPTWRVTARSHNRKARARAKLTENLLNAWAAHPDVQLQIRRIMAEVFGLRAMGASEEECTAHLQAEARKLLDSHPVVVEEVSE